MKSKDKLHIGCGTTTPSDWINIDGSWNAWIAKHSILHWILGVFHVIPMDKLTIQWNKNIFVHDVRKGLPFRDNCFSAIYASHLLEHLYPDEAKELLRECGRVLKPGGVIRLVVPDLRSIVLEYLGERPFGDLCENWEKMSAGDRLCLRLNMCSQTSSGGNIFYRLYTTFKDFHSHKWMYDANSLMKQMSEAGFVNISQRQFLDSAIPCIEEVEIKDRVLDGEGVCIEGMKPYARSFSNPDKST